MQYQLQAAYCIPNDQSEKETVTDYIFLSSFLLYMYQPVKVIIILQHDP